MARESRGNGGYMSLFSLNPFKGLRGGDVVKFWIISAGERKEVTAAVNRMLVFDDHVVVKRGPFGAVVDGNNFIKLVRRARRKA